MQQFIETSLVGGRDGVIFSDIFFRQRDGSFVINDAGKDKLDIEHPVKEIIVYYSDIVEGIKVTYRLADGNTTSFQHGGGPAPGRRDWPMTFDDTDTLVGVMGLAGYHPDYKRELIQTASFMINNGATATTRIFGPFGQDKGGKSFYCTDVLAFGGFAQDSPDPRLSGLSFFKNLGTD